MGAQPTGPALAAPARLSGDWDRTLSVVSIPQTMGPHGRLDRTLSVTAHCRLGPHIVGVFAARNLAGPGPGLGTVTRSTRPGPTPYRHHTQSTPHHPLPTPHPTDTTPHLIGQQHSVFRASLHVAIRAVQSFCAGGLVRTEWHTETPAACTRRWSDRTPQQAADRVRTMERSNGRGLLPVWACGRGQFNAL